MRDCGPGNAPLVGFDSEPTSPAPGDNVSSWIAYNVMSPITDGTATYTYSFNGIPFSPTVDDLCVDTNCPKDVGFYNETSTMIFPDVSGKIVAKLAWRDQNDALIWCVETTWKVS
jgi:hypothetical protein